MYTAMESFWEELQTSEMHIRDKWQFELKSEFFTSDLAKKKFSTAGKNQYIQEFYFFVPNSLQINSSSYSKEQFYLDQTNFIRYKTPEFCLRELVNQHVSSPLAEILNLSQKEPSEQHCEQLSYQLKLFGAVLRSAFRSEVRAYLLQFDKKSAPLALMNEMILQFCADVRVLKDRFQEAQARFAAHWKNMFQEWKLGQQIKYINMYMEYVINAYLTGLLEAVRLQQDPQLAAADEALSSILLQLEAQRDFFVGDALLQEAGERKRAIPEEEKVLYIRGLLNKFVMDALQLSVNRVSLAQRARHWIGGLSAGIAMLIFILLYFWLGNVFVINSLPFLLLTVLIYILKDRIKEAAGFLSFQQAAKWFPDFTTEILSPDTQRVGMMKETFSFLEPPQLPEEILNIRNREFHEVLEEFHRPESVLFYKRVVEIEQSASLSKIKSRGINIIFRFNILRFLAKAGDPYETHLIMDPKTRKLVNIELPKVYHLNLIIKSRVMQDAQSPKLELKKFRIVINKKGIKRIEQIGHAKG
jgi:hypothetical protein